MKVLYLHQHFATPDGAGGTRSYEFARALIARGHQVTMVCGLSDFAQVQRSDGEVETVPTRASRREIDGIDVIELPLAYSNHDSLLKRSRVFFRFALGSVVLALREDYDLLFATSTPLTAAIPGIVMKIFRRKPFVFEVRDLWPELPRAMGVVRNPVILGGMGALEWLSYRMSDACIGLSPGIVEGIARRSQAGHPISMIPNGCDLDLFQPALRRAPPIPGVAPGDVVAVFTGAHGLANGLRAVLDAAAVLQKRGRGKIKFVFIGDGKQKPMLEKRARDEALDNCVFLKPIRKRDLTMLLAASDIGLMILSNVPAFYFGTSPNKFFDYLAAGLPVLCNYPGWLADMIAEHQCGLAVPPDDPEAFADAMERLADSAKSQMAMGKNARALGESRFSRERISADFIQTLEAAFTSYAANWSDRSRFDLPLIK